ncbi:hypothetical protein [Selenomonas sp. KH1T6]|uniref:hypothetical protein n=1 Tax=Selenomonas sp. KH1T6 TaxID=3158784 RepID=UPI0008A740E3|nr:hypothetical protein SAMN05216583_1417 [Selenomonas ruminantium]
MLRDIEKDKLENGMYIRFCLCTEDDFDTKKIAKELLTIENVKYSEAINSKVIIFIIYVEDPYAPPKTFEKVRNKRAMQNRYAQELICSDKVKQLKLFMEKHPIDKYYIYYTTTNWGSYLVGFSGRIEYKKNSSPQEFKSEINILYKKDYCDIRTLRKINEWDLREIKETEPFKYSFLSHLWRYVALNADELKSI